ncbi:MAG TPA: hypothetical protein VEW42_04125 [Candidatus Eisenbacteria bacterium]|nr:hypothetical protein [Candidatus Eisenbacteria bacterium]
MNKEIQYRKFLAQTRWQQIVMEAIGAVGVSVLAAQVVLHSLIPQLLLR